MLAYDVDNRISAQEALQHPWMTNASRQTLDAGQAVLIFNNMKKFRADHKLQKATLTFIASQLSTKSERDEMMNVFKAIDTDNNGALSREELINGFSQIFGEGQENIEEEVDKIMSNVDTDHSGEIDYTEFIIATMNRQKLLSKERLQAAFNAFDKDGSGSISSDELKQMLGGAGTHADSMWDELIQEVDQNGDGEIDLKEFTDMMLKHLN